MLPHRLPVPIVGPNYIISHGLLFDGSSYLSRTPSTTGNRQAWTFSCWVKFSELGTFEGSIFFAGSASNNHFILRRNSSDQIDFYHFNQSGSSSDFYYTSDAVFRDPSAWYHIVLSIGTAASDVALSVNGVEQTLTENTAKPANFVTVVNSTVPHEIGRDAYSGPRYMRGYIAEPILVDGAALDYTSFAKFNIDGDYVPIKLDATSVTGVSGDRIPHMTSNTTPFGTASASSEFSTSYQAWQAMSNGTGSFYWATNTGIGGVGWLQYQFASAKAITCMAATMRSSGINFPSAWSLKASNTGVFGGEEVTLDTQSGISWSHNETKLFTFSNSTSYTHYRWDITATNGNDDISCQEFELYESTSGIGDNGFLLDFSSTDHFGFDAASNTTANSDDGKTILYLDMEGSDTGTTFTDQSYNSLAVTANGNANTATAQSKFGSSSAEFDGTGDYLSIPDSDLWNWGTQEWTLECWVRFNVTTGQQIIFAKESALNDRVRMNVDFFGGNGAVFFCQDSGGTSTTVSQGATTGWSTNTWYHVIFTNDNGTIRIYRDGTQIASSTLNAGIPDTTAAVNIGTQQVGTSFDFNGYIDQYRILVGSCLYPGGTGFTSPTAVPAAPQQNGFFDNGLVAADQVKDTPTDDADNVVGNYATLNRLKDQTTRTWSEGNTRVLSNTDGTWRLHPATIRVPLTGKWAFKATLRSVVGYVPVGFCLDPGNQIGDSNITAMSPPVADGVQCYHSEISKRVNSSNTTQTGLAGWSQNDELEVLLDNDNGTCIFKLNGVQYGSTVTGLNPLDTAFIGTYGGSSYEGEVDFGQKGYTPSDSSYKTLCTANLPDYGINPTDHFATVLYTGNGAAIGSGGNAVTDVGFDLATDGGLVWIKDRYALEEHVLFDTVSGATNSLFAGTTAIGEQTTPESLASFDSDGFTLGNDNTVNRLNDSYVAWVFRANGTAVTNTDGSLTSNVSANTTAGFSCGTFTGTETNQTVGHGLDQAPEFLICSSTAAGPQTAVFHSDAPTGVLYLDSTSILQTADFGAVWQSTAPDSNVFYVGTSNNSNDASTVMRFFAWHSVPGFSRVGTFAGFADSFVSLDFEPGLVIYKDLQNADNWYMADTTRTTYNKGSSPDILYANQTNIEATHVEWDFVSNGLKFRHGGNTNKHIFIAFAKGNEPAGAAQLRAR